MSDYMDILSSYYKNVNGASGTQSYSSLLNSLTDVSSKTGLESLNELGGEDDNSDFLSVLADQMGISNTTTTTASNAANNVMAEKLENALSNMDETTEPYKYVNDVYNYLVGLSSSSAALDDLYKSSDTKGTAAISEERYSSNSAQSGIQNQINTINENDIENSIEETIGNNIDLSGLPHM